MANFVSNDDALEVLDKYAKGIKKGIGVVAVRETSPAAAAHAVGDYIRYSGTVYKVKSAISIGDSLILNTNIEAHGLPDNTTIYTPGLDEENFSEEISSIVNVYGCKNALPNYDIASGTEQAGVTLTYNSENIITVSGTLSSTYTMFELLGRSHELEQKLEKNPYKLSLESTGTSGHYLRLYFYQSDMTFISTIDVAPNSEAIIVVPANAYYTYLHFAVTNAGGASINLSNIRIMLRDARIKDSTYAPYAMTNRELTEAITKKTVIRAREVTYNTGIVPFNNVEKVMCIEFSDGSILVNGVITITNDWDADGVSEMIFQLPSGIDTSSAKLAKNIWVSFERVYASSGSPAEKLTGYFDTNNRFVRWGTTTKSGYVRGVYIINFSF